MNKEEILAKSRKENKGHDVAEADKARSAAKFAITASLTFTALWTMLSFIAAHRVNFAVIAAEFCMVFSMQLYSALKSRKLADVFLALLSGSAFIMMTAIAICELLNIRP